ncbi:MAG TPA: DNA topoisomerase IB [Acidimicrobiia bacterium]|nr:DNA topoisomerase IB [Acidimicrobiia bacterium]
MTALLDDDLPPGLFWVDDSAPGIRRRKRGQGFSYTDADGRAVRDEDTLARIRALAVPPAWTDVWICSDALGHLQATGRDAKGRKQYRYNARFRAHRDETKFARLYEFGSALPDIRRTVADDLGRAGMPIEKVTAAVVRLLEATLVRVGNEEYARENGSYGLTTLRDKHAVVGSGGFRLVFKGKHGISTNVAVQDRRLRSVVKRCQDLPGQVLFQYIDDDGESRPVSSSDVNAYLRRATTLDITAKDFRTWMATLLAACAFAELPPPRSHRQGRQSTARVLEVVADHLGNTPAVCRASYVHPLVIDAYADSSFPDLWSAASARGSRLLIPEERKLCALLRPNRRRATRLRAA